MYMISCLRCLLLGTTSNYYGEGSRTCYLRGLEHSKALEKKEETSVLWQHCLEHHGGSVQEFRMKVVKQHRNSFERQLNEAVSILTDTSDIIMDRKA